MNDAPVVWIAVIILCLAGYVYRGRVARVMPPPLPHHGKRASEEGHLPLHLALLPSFLTTPNFAGDHHDTSYLDGLRGIACLAVFNTHTVRWLHSHVDQAFARSTLDYNIWQFPGLRAVHTGVFAVAIFFVISGFALSIGSVRLMAAPNRDAANFQGVTASAILRRPVRLFLPAWACVVHTVLLLRTGAMDAVRFFAGDVHVERGDTSGMLSPAEGLLPELHRLLVTNFQLLHVFKESNWMAFASPYKIQLWTIPIEFRASLGLYLTHVALFSVVQRRKRVVIVAVGMMIAVLGDNMDMLLFWGGYLLAERHAWKEGAVRTETKHSPTLLWGLLFAACYVGALPVIEADASPLYSWLIALTPPTYTDPLRFWGAIGAFGAVFVAGELSSLTVFLSSPPLRYLGRLSFGLYLMHTDVNMIVGWPVLWGLWEILGREGIGGAMGFVLAYLILFVAQIWVADLFYRAVDRTCVRLAKSLVGRVLRS